MTTLKRDKFVKEYVISGNATEAAIKAGYSIRTARSQGCELLKIPYISEQINIYRDRLRNETIASSNEIEQRLTEIMREDIRDARGNIKRMPNISAAMELNRMRGLTDKGIELNIDSALFIAKVKELEKEYLGENGGLIEDKS